MAVLPDLRRRLVAGVCLALLAVLTPRPACAAPGDGVFYSRQRVFLIPYQTVVEGDKRVQKVVLHVSENRGKDYFESGVAGPGNGQFKFTTDHDAEYWFAVQTVDTQGLKHPADLTLAQPSLKVVVDTLPPQVTFGPAPARDGAAVEWTVSDTGSGVDLKTLRLDYLPPGGQQWLPLSDVQQSALGSHRWTPTMQGSMRVRLQVKDRAGNIAEREITLGPGATSTAGNTSMGAATSPLDAASGALMVNKKTFNLTYNIENDGPSGVKGVDVYYLFVGTDGKEGDWVQYTTTGLAPAKGPFQMSVPQEGRYGITLLAKSGADLSEPPPRRGDRPHLWVEVDETPPVVRITALEMGKGLSYGRVTIRWEATDRHLTARPIRILYSDRADALPAEWKPIADSLSNTERNGGSYVWDLQNPRERLPVRVFVRVEAADQAGNIGSDVSKDSIPTDLSIPRARPLGVEAVGLGVATGPGPAPMGIGAVPISR
jgi:hypothetical protein